MESFLQGLYNVYVINIEDARFCLSCFFYIMFKCLEILNQVTSINIIRYYTSSLLPWLHAVSLAGQTKRTERHMLRSLYTSFASSSVIDFFIHTLREALILFIRLFSNIFYSGFKAQLRSPPTSLTAYFPFFLAHSSSFFFCNAHVYHLRVQTCS